MIFLINLAAALCTLCGGGFFLYVVLLTGSYQNPGSLLLLIGIPVVFVVSLVFSRASFTSNHMLWAWLPIMYIGSMFILFPVVNQFMNQHIAQVHASYIERTEAKIPAFLNTVTKDFTCSTMGNAGRTDFITIDKDQGVLIYVTSGRGFVRPSLLGRLSGNTLELFSEIVSPDMAQDSPDPWLVRNYHRYLDPCVTNDGKTIFDLYTVVYDGPSNTGAYNTKLFDAYRDPEWMGIDYVHYDEYYRYKGITTGILESDRRLFDAQTASDSRAEIITRYALLVAGKADDTDVDIIDSLLFRGSFSQDTPDTEIETIRTAFPSKVKADILARYERVKGGKVGNTDLQILFDLIVKYRYLQSDTTIDSATDESFSDRFPKITDSEIISIQKALVATYGSYWLPLDER